MHRFYKNKNFTGALRKHYTHTPNEKFELNVIAVNPLAYWAMAMSFSPWEKKKTSNLGANLWLSFSSSVTPETDKSFQIQRETENLPEKAWKINEDNI